MATQQTTLFAWGRQRQGQCGSPEIVTDRTWPQEVEHFPMTPKIIACANERSIVVTDDNQIFSVGQGLMGELGLGYVTQVSLPDVVKIAPQNWIQIGMGNEHTIALAENGEMWAWGANELGQLGVGHSKMVDRPTKVLTNEKFTQISCGASHSVGLTSYGEIYSWGGSYSGQAGTDSKTTDFTLPTKVVAPDTDKTELPTFRFVTTGDYCSAAISMTGDLWTWGAGGHGRLGLGNTISWNSPQLVKEIQSVKQVSVSANHMLAIDETGRLYAWGAAHNGELGTGKRLREMRPVMIESEERFIAVAAGFEYSLAISDAGSLFGWGSCANGVLGNGRKVGSVIKPKRIKAGDIVWRSISTHRYHVLGTGQGKSCAPEGWSFAKELIDPDAPVIEEDQTKTEGGEVVVKATEENATVSEQV